jgi:hypothetical protein
MAVTFNTVGLSLSTNTVSAFVDVLAPSAILTDDIMIACCMGKPLGNVMSAPDGSWTQIVQADGDCTLAANDHRYAIFWKRAVSTDSDATFRFTKVTDDNNIYAAVIGVWTGAATSGSPLDDTAAAATTTAAQTDTVSFPAFNPTGTDSHIIFVAFYGNDLTTFAAAMSNDTDPDCTIRWDYETSADTDLTIACTSGDTTDGANIAARTWASVSTTDAGSTGVVFALKTPAAGGLAIPVVMAQYRQRHA